MKREFTVTFRDLNALLKLAMSEHTEPEDIAEWILDTIGLPPDSGMDDAFTEPSYDERESGYLESGEPYIVRSAFTESIYHPETNELMINDSASILAGWINRVQQIERGE